MTNEAPVFDRESAILSGTGALDEFEKRLAEVRSLDKQRESERRRVLNISIGLLAVAVVTFVYLYSFGFGEWTLLGLVPLTAAGGGLFRWFRMRRADLLDERYELAERVLRLIRPDVDEPVRIRLDLTRCDSPNKKVSDGEVGYWKVAFYEDAWLEVAGKLADHTRFRLAVTDRMQHRTRWSRNSRGKNKRKTKTKASVQVALRLRPAEGRFSGLGGMSRDAAAAIRLPSWAGIKQLQVDDRSLTLIVSVDASPHTGADEMTRDRGGAAARLIAMSFLSLYEVLNRAPRGSAATAGVSS